VSASCQIWCYQLKFVLALIIRATRGQMKYWHFRLQYCLKQYAHYILVFQIIFIIIIKIKRSIHVLKNASSKIIPTGPDFYRTVPCTCAENSSPRVKLHFVMKVTVFWDVTPCRVVEVYRRFTVACTIIVRWWRRQQELGQILTFWPLCRHWSEPPKRVHLAARAREIVPTYRHMRFTTSTSPSNVDGF
jgi:hypothetical protein